MHRSPTTRLYIVRHGETEYNRQGIVQGRKIDSVLNATGVEQAHALGEHFADTAFDAVYSSGLRRALQTAHIVCGYQLTRREVRIDADFAEMSWGIFEGKPLDHPAVRAGIDEIKRVWAAGRFEQPVEAGESITAVRDRGLRALDRVVRRHSGERVLIVTHGRFIRILIASVLDEFGLERMEDVAHDNTGINVLHHGPAGYRAELLNALPHLQAAE